MKPRIDPSNDAVPTWNDEVWKFKNALDAAYYDLFITWQEREAALAKFIAEKRSEQ